MIGTIIGTGLGVASSLIGGALSSSANKRAQRLAAEQKARDDAWYTKKMNESYADTAAGQNLIRQAKDYATDNWKKAQGASAVGGGTDAATAMAKESGNRVMQNTLGNIAAQDTARQDSFGQQKMQNDKAYTQQQVAFAQQKANNISSVASSAGNALTQLGSAFDKPVNVEKSV